MRYISVARFGGGTARGRPSLLSHIFGVTMSAHTRFKSTALALMIAFAASPTAAYAASSPITYVDRVRAPVLIIQGRHDTRTPARPVEEYERRMRALGKDIRVVWFEAGHLGAGAEMEQSIRHFETMLEFAQAIRYG